MMDLGGYSPKATGENLNRMKSLGKNNKVQGCVFDFNCIADSISVEREKVTSDDAALKREAIDDASQGGNDDSSILNNHIIKTTAAALNFDLSQFSSLGPAKNENDDSDELVIPLLTRANARFRIGAMNRAGLQDLAKINEIKANQRNEVRGSEERRAKREKTIVIVERNEGWRGGY